MTWRRLGDVGLWAALSFLVIAESGARSDPYWMQGLSIGVLALALFGRRRWPLAALTVVAGVEIVLVAIGLGTANGVQIALVPAVTLLSYLAGRRETQLKHFVLVCSWSLLGMLVLGLAIGGKTEAFLNWLVMLLLALLLVVLPWLIGRYRAQQALLVSAGWERAERIEREQRMAIDQERLRERSRIAEDMHDSVGHELSLIALQAAALELDPTLPAEHRQAATSLRESAATATERLGEIVGVLRDAEAPVIPHDETVAALVERAAASGLKVRLVDNDQSELSPMVDRAVHRVVQESLTNASKHAPGALVTVTITGTPDALKTEIVDTGAIRPVSAPKGGRGLDGLRERVRLVGGSLTAAPRPDGGFEVIATMPRAGGRPEPPTPTTAEVERATVRRSARRGLITAIVAPLILGALVGAVALGYYLVAGYSSILRPRQYDALHIGQSEDEIGKLLPAMQMLDAPYEGYDPPAGWTCRYYRPDAPFSTNYAYRLCFSQGALVTKSIVQTGSVAPTPEETG